MPYGSLTCPSPALGLIKSSLTQAGLDSRVFNLIFDFARLMGQDGYEMISLFKGTKTQVGEWLFAEQAWGRSFGPSEEWFLDQFERELSQKEGLIKRPQIPDMKSWLMKLRHDVIPSYLWQCLTRLETAGDLEVVGFSCSLFQTVSSLALGRLIKQEHPETKLVYGGACFHDVMGEELIKKVPWIDAVSTGEADDVVVPLFHALSSGRAPSELQGILYRDDQEIVSGPASHPVSTEVFESIPDPDYSDFFLDAGRVGLLDDYRWRKRICLAFESSRGCWWGEKQHCTFCGLNGKDIAFRAKSPERVYRTLANYERLYPDSICEATDNNLPENYLDTLIPKLKSDPPRPGMKIFYEVKSNMAREQIRAMSDAGMVYIQPGIESLSTHLLKLMHKGVSAIQNLYFLKCCREFGIFAFWNNLLRIPGERPQDYAKMASMIPSIYHLNPPYGGCIKIECQRFSPYFLGQAKGIKSLRPSPWYEAVFPPDLIDLERVAYFFDAVWEETLDDGAYREVMTATRIWLASWMKRPQLPKLIMHRREDGSLAVEDTRDSANDGILIGTRGGTGDCRGDCISDRSCKEWKLDDIEAAIYSAIQDPASAGKAAFKVSNVAGITLEREEARHHLRHLVEMGLAVEENGVFLGLALDENFKEIS